LLGLSATYEATLTAGGRVSTKRRRSAWLNAGIGATVGGMDEGAIHAEGLEKHFGDIKAVDGVDLSVPAGTVFGLLGPNGAGKTTVVRMLTTILRPDAGRATVLGIDVARHPETVRERIGLAGQFAAVDENLTGRENLVMVARLTHQPRAVHRPRAAELLEQFDLTEAADRPVRTYSGGMRRRLDLAAALVHRPPVLFLDEPTTGLDPRSRQELWGTIQALVDAGTTLLLTTQYLEEADRLADRIAVVDHGRVIAEGTASELKARLGATIITVGLGHGADLDDLKSRLGSFGAVDVEPGESRIGVKVAEGSRAVIDVVRALDAAAAPVESIEVREPSLDDVFLELTGHRTGIVDEEEDR
jgi:ABC-2 type transport system ATP-binding protein